MLSHRQLWLQATQTGQNTIILEDDAIIHNRADRLIWEVLEVLPYNWDFIALGWNFDCPIQLELVKDAMPVQLTFSKDLSPSKLSIFQNSWIAPIGHRLTWCFGTPGYIISPVGAEKLIKGLFPLKQFVIHTNAGSVENKGIDVALNTIYSKLNAYACFPPLVLTANDKTRSTTGVAA
jgi:glycosyl transferase family 25